jgi:acetyl esterase/lipase
MSGDTLGSLRLTWYNNIDQDKTVEVCNYLKSHAEAGETVFYDIYSDEEKAEDPAKEDTGLFFFRGDPSAKFAIINAGGGFAYVGAMHDSFPHALELSKKGYNAFALIYRPGAQTACEDLARAIAFIFEHAEELEVDTSDYSLWGGSAGARMAAWLGSYGTESFGEDAYPRPAAVLSITPGFQKYMAMNRPPTALSGQATALLPTERWNGAFMPFRQMERMQRSKSFMVCPTASGLARALLRKDGSIAPWHSGNAI